MRLDKDAMDLIKVCYGSDVDGYKQHYKIMRENAKKSVNGNTGYDYDYANVNNLVKTLENKEFSEHQNIYITKNTFKGNITDIRIVNKNIELGRSSALDIPKGRLKFVKRTENNIYGLKNIVIDVDYHDDNASYDDVESFKGNFLKNWEDVKDEIPTPTALFFSGRGFHIYYTLELASSKLLWLYKMVARELCDAVEKAIEEAMPNNSKYCKIDRAASLNCSGIIRLPGTNNTKAMADMGVYDLNEDAVYNIDALREELGIVHTPKQRKRYFKANNNKSNITSKAMLDEVLKNRLRIIRQAVNNNGRCEGEGYRHNYIFVYYATVKPLVGSETKALSETRKFNQDVFDTPIKDNELVNIARCVDKKGTYKLTNERFAEFLDLDKTEMFKYGLDGASRNHKRNVRKKEATAIRKAIRDKKIIDVFSETGSYKETMRQVGVCENTIRKVLKANSKILERIKIKERNVRNRLIFSSYIRNKGHWYCNSSNPEKRNAIIQKAAKAGKCCTKTAEEVIAKYEELSKTLKMCIKRDDKICNNTVNSMLAIMDGRATNSPFACHRNGKLTKQESRWLVGRIAKYFNLDWEDVSIAFCPYIPLVEN